MPPSEISPEALDVILGLWASLKSTRNRMAIVDCAMPEFGILLPLTSEEIQMNSPQQSMLSVWSGTKLIIIDGLSSLDGLHRILPEELASSRLFVSELAGSLRHLTSARVTASSPVKAEESGQREDADNQFPLTAALMRIIAEHLRNKGPKARSDFYLKRAVQRVQRLSEQDASPTLLRLAQLHLKIVSLDSRHHAKPPRKRAVDSFSELEITG